MGVLNNELTINTELQTENFTAQSSAESHEEMFTIIQKLQFRNKLGSLQEIYLISPSTSDYYFSCCCNVKAEQIRENIKAELVL